MWYTMQTGARMDILNAYNRNPSEESSVLIAITDCPRMDMVSYRTLTTTPTVPCHIAWELSLTDM